MAGQSPGVADHAALLVDGSALFFAARALFPDRNLNYHELSKIIQTHVGDLRIEPALFFSSVDIGNEKQVKFVEFVEQNLGWTVQRVAPHEASMCNPLLTDAVFRSIRFDAWLAYALGRLTTKPGLSKIVVVSDSWPLAGPVRECAARDKSIAVCFFGAVIDTRWHKVFRESTEAFSIDFLDLDNYTEVLFNRARTARGKEGNRLTLLD